MTEIGVSSVYVMVDALIHISLYLISTDLIWMLNNMGWLILLHSMNSQIKLTIKPCVFATPPLFCFPSSLCDASWATVLMIFLPHSWSAKLYLTPSNIVLLTAIALIGVCVFILAIIGILHWQEKVRFLLWKMFVSITRSSHFLQ